METDSAIVVPAVEKDHALAWKQHGVDTQRLFVGVIMRERCHYVEAIVRDRVIAYAGHLSEIRGLRLNGFKAIGVRCGRGER
jgi:hypothetical protein